MMIRLAPLALLLSLPLAPLAHADDGLDALVLDPSCTALCPGGDATGWQGDGGAGAFGGRGGNAALNGDGGRGGNGLDAVYCATNPTSSCIPGSLISPATATSG